MTHQNESNPLEQMIQVLDEHGFDGMARAIGILVNEAMKIERADVLGAQPYERTGFEIGCRRIAHDYLGGKHPRVEQSARFRRGLRTSARTGVAGPFRRRASKSDGTRTAEAVAPNACDVGVPMGVCRPLRAPREFPTSVERGLLRGTPQRDWSK
jgi:putative transposase